RMCGLGKLAPAMRHGKGWEGFGGGMVGFFSSGRRHTRCLSGWSSDVCSSDLVPESVFSLQDDIAPVTKESCAGGTRGGYYFGRSPRDRGHRGLQAADCSSRRSRATSCRGGSHLRESSRERKRVCLRNSLV